MTQQTLPYFEKEETDLELHVKMCAERYKDLDDRLVRLDAKTDKIIQKIDQNRSDLTKILITTAGSILVSIIGLAGILLTKF